MRRSPSHEVQERSVRGLRIPVSVRKVAGDAPPLLLLNGIGAPYPLWGRTRELLNRTTVTFDVRAAMLGRRPSVRTFAGLVAELLADLRLPQVDVLGLSWGGIATQQVVHDHPRLFRRVVLVSTTPGFAAVPGQPAALRTVLTPRRDPARARELVRDLYRGDFVGNPALVDDLLRRVGKRDEESYRRQLRALLGWTSVHWLLSVRHPTLILHAEDDPVCPYANAHLMHRLIRRSELTRVPGGGHLFVFTRPQESAQLVEDFLDRPEAF